MAHLCLIALQVKFCQNRLISGSVDGLVNVFDVSNGFDEDEGFLVSQQRCEVHLNLMYLAQTILWH